MKSIKKLHKYFFGLAVLASLVSFSGYVNHNSLQVNNTEWVVGENILPSNTAFFYVKTKGVRVSSIKSFYNFNFDCLLSIQQGTYNLNFKVANRLRLQFKSLNSFFELKYTNSFFNRDSFYSNFLV